MVLKKNDSLSQNFIKAGAESIGYLALSVPYLALFRIPSRRSAFIDWNSVSLKLLVDCIRLWYVIIKNPAWKKYLSALNNAQDSTFNVIPLAENSDRVSLPGSRWHGDVMQARNTYVMKWTKAEAQIQLAIQEDLQTFRLVVEDRNFFLNPPWNGS